MSTRRRIGILGGTFDPVHYGHLDAAAAAAAALALDEIVLMPSADPPHRDPTQVSAYHRFALLALAASAYPGWRVSDAELTRGGRSYTMDTLRALHAAGLQASQIFFIIGADAFAEIAIWRGYPGVLDLANFVVVARPGTTLSAAAARNPSLAPRLCRASDWRDESAANTGILLVDAPTRDISSTTIRARLARGESIADLVPEPVARHIAANSLYGAVNGLHGQDEPGTSPSGAQR